MEKKGIAIIIILAILCVCVAMSIPIIVVEYMVQEPYSTTETYYVTEPYTTTETYYESEPHLEYAPLRYKASDWSKYNHFFSDRFDLSVSVKNTDDVSGSFWVNFHAVGTQGTYDTSTYSETLFPGDSYRFHHTFSGSYLSGCSYEVEQTGKSVTKFSDVAKEREVIELHEVAKERTVTKYRDVTKYKNINAFEYIMQEYTIAAIGR